MGCTVTKTVIQPLVGCSEMVRIESCIVNCLSFEEWNTLTSVPNFNRKKEATCIKPGTVLDERSKVRPKWRGLNEGLHTGTQQVHVRKPRRDLSAFGADREFQASQQFIDKEIFRQNIRKSFIIVPKSGRHRGFNAENDSQNSCHNNLPASLLVYREQNQDSGSGLRLDSRDDDLPIRERHRSGDFQTKVAVHKQKRQSIFFKLGASTGKNSQQTKQEESPQTKPSQYNSYGMKDPTDTKKRVNELSLQREPPM